MVLLFLCIKADLDGVRGTVIIPYDVQSTLRIHWFLQSLDLYPQFKHIIHSSLPLFMIHFYV